MSTISLKEYAPIICDKNIASTVYNTIKSALPDQNSITIDMGGIISMTTYCAKMIFGSLYIELGSDTFFKNVILKNASDDIQLIIKMGISSAIEQQEE